VPDDAGQRSGRIYKGRNVQEEKSIVNCPKTWRRFLEERDWNCTSGKAYKLAE